MEGALEFFAGTKEFFIQNGALGLFILSFAEASFFPIPPDFVLLSLCIIEPRNAIYYSVVTSAASTLGGVFGYFIGMRAGRPVLSRLVKSENFGKIEEAFSRYGGWAVAVAGFTPIPYKVFTIASGVFRIKLSTFFIAALLSRSARFLLQGVIVAALGENALSYINRYLGPGSFLLMGLAAASYFLLKRVKLRIKVNPPRRPTNIPAREKLENLAQLYGEFGIYMLAGFCIASILGISFIKLATELLEKELEGIDQAVTLWIVANGSPFMDYVARAVDLLANPFLLTILILSGIIATAIFGKKKIYSFISLLDLAGSFAIQWGLKSLFQRPRIVPTSQPLDFLAYSFPSGLILLITAFVGYIGFLGARASGGLKRSGIIVGWLLLMAVAGGSRIYVGISYPSDVLAGFLIGGVWLTICVLATKALEHYRLS